MRVEYLPVKARCLQALGSLKRVEADRDENSGEKFSSGRFSLLCQIVAKEDSSKRDAKCDHRSLGIGLVDKVEYLREVLRVGCTVRPRVLDLDSAPASEVEHTDPGPNLGLDHPDQRLVVVTLGGARDARQDQQDGCLLVLVLENFEKIQKNRKILRSLA